MLSALLESKLKAPCPATESIVCRHSKQKGFALIITLSLMALVILLLVTLTTVVRIENQAASSAQQQIRAKLNALLGLSVAVGELQKYAGPDQRVTARAEILEDTGSPPVGGGRFWTGVWNSDPEDSSNGDHLSWLISGSSPDPEDTPATVDGVEPILLKSGLNAASPLNPGGENLDVVAEVEPIDPDSTPEGYFAYWVADEGVKAKVNLLNPFGESAGSSTDYEKMIASWRSFPRTALELVEGFTSLSAPSVQPSKADQLEDFDQLTLLSPTVNETLVNDPVLGDDRLKTRFHDLTLHSYGLLTNVRDGGFRKDLTRAMEDDTTFNDELAGEYLWILDEVNPTLPAKGPRWEFVRDYYRIKDRLRTAGGVPYDSTIHSPFNLEMDTVRPITLAEQTENWQYGVPYMWWYQPYRQYGEPGSRMTNPDYDVITHPIMPVLTHFQVHYSVAAEQARDDAGNFIENTVLGENPYVLVLKIHVVLTLWNPYNVSLNLSEYSNSSEGELKISWKSNPQLEFTLYDGASSTVRHRLHTTLADIQAMQLATSRWNRYEGNSSDDVRARSRFKMEIPASEIGTMLPGEVLQFSIPSTVNVSQSDGWGSGSQELDTAELENAWNENGGFVVRDIMMLGPEAPTDFSSVVEYDVFSSFNKGDTRSKSDYTWVRWPPVYDENDPATAGNVDRFGRAGDTITVAIRGSYTEDGSLGGTAGKGDLDSNLSASVWYKKKEEIGGNYGEPLTTGFSGISVLQTDPIQFGPSSLGLLNATGIADAPTVGGYVYRLKDATASDNATAAMDIPYFAQWNPRATVFNNGNSALNWQESGVSTNSVGSWIVYPHEDATLINPQNTNSAGGRLQSFFGRGHLSNTGSTATVAFEVPRTALTSIGDLQHANLSFKSNAEPAYAVGNSYASSQLDFDQYYRLNSGNVGWVDSSYLLNDALWDGYFFSTIPQSTAAGDYPLDPDPDKTFDESDIESGDPLPNARYKFFTPAPGSVAVEDLQDFQEAARYLTVDGAFNLNSTSVEAWKAVLAGLNGEEASFAQPDFSGTGLADYTEADTGIPSNNEIPLGRYGLFFGDWTDNNASLRWGGQRTLTESELGDLAEEIVAEIKSRAADNGGRPFLSIAEFVNRKIDVDPAVSLSGTLQTAIDRSGINSAMDDVVDTSDISSAQNEDALEIPVMANTPNFLSSADIMRLLGPSATARSDTFLIRTYGRANGPTGSGPAYSEVICEAVAQRVPGGETGADNRPFTITFLRWLNKNEI